MGIFFCDRCQQIPDENDRCGCDRAADEGDEGDSTFEACAECPPELPKPALAGLAECKEHYRERYERARGEGC